MATSLSRSNPLSKSLSLKSPTKPTSSAQTPTKSSHLAMVELKSRVLSSLSKLSDRDTQQIAIDDLEKLIRSLPPDGVPVLVNSLTHDPPEPVGKFPPLILRRESLKLISLLCSVHPEPSFQHLGKILSHVTRRLKDAGSDSSVRDACRDLCGTLASIYVSNEATAGLFVKPLMEVTAETGKAAQAGAAMCIAKVVESSGSVNGVNTAPLFQKLCPRICKLLSIQGFLAKGALLNVLSSLAQVGAISPQNMQQVLQTTRDCLENSDWATRKAAADTLNVLSAHSAHLIGDGAAPTLSALESCRFDKVKPVRDSMTEALQQWKKMSDEQTTVEDSKEGTNNQESADPDNKTGKRTPTKTRNSESGCASPTNSESSIRTRGSLLEKASFLLRKKAPELNSEFFQKLEPGKSKCTDDLPVEVVAPPPPARKGQNSQVEKTQEVEKSENEEESEEVERDGDINYQNAPEKRVWGESRGSRGSLGMKFKGTEGEENNYQNGPGSASTSLRGGGSVEGYFGNNGNGGGNGNNKGNWTPIQRQLAHLERQQTSLMTMLQEFMGGSHDSMVTLENRVRGLERIVEDMSRDLSLSSSSSRRPSIPSRPSYPKYTRFMADQQPSWNPRQSDPDTWQHDHYSYGRSASMGNRRGLPAGGARRGWEKGLGFRLGEGPSARSAWQASKDEATLEAIRVAGGEDSHNNVSTGSTRLPVREREREREPMLDEEVVNGPGAGRGEEWEAWTRSMDALQVGDVDGAYNEILGTGDAFLLVKLMEQTGPVVDQLTAEVGNEVMHAVGQLLMEESYFGVALAWLQQLAELVMENGPDFLEIPNEGKREILLNLGEIPENEIPEDWDGASPDEIMAQLASSWGINLQHLFN